MYGNFNIIDQRWRPDVIIKLLRQILRLFDAFFTQTRTTSRLTI